MILVFGSINLDLIFPVPFLPRSGDTVLSAEGQIAPGGKGANQAVAAARAGARVALAGAVGADMFADAALAGLGRAGVNVERVARLEGSTGRAAICVDPQGHNIIAVAAGNNLRARASLVEDAALGAGTTLLLQMETDPGENAALIRRARALGTRIILNLAPALAIDSEALRSVDMLVGNANEIAWLGERLGTGSNAGSIHAALGLTCVRTVGVQGAEMVSDDGFLHVPAMTVESRDSTGAGDCFVGVFAAALDRGLGFGAALHRAAAAAALSTGTLGAQSSMPGNDEIEAALARIPAPTSEQPTMPE